MRAKKVFENINDLLKPKDLNKSLNELPWFEGDISLDTEVALAAPRIKKDWNQRVGYYFEDLAKQKYNVKVDYDVSSYKVMGITGKVKDIINLYQEWFELDEEQAFREFIHILKFNQG